MIMGGMRSAERGRRRMSLFASAATAVRWRLLFAHEVILGGEVLGLKAIRLRLWLRLGRRSDRRGLRRLQVVGEGEWEGLEARGRGVAKAGFLFPQLCSLPVRPDQMETGTEHSIEEIVCSTKNND